MGVGGFEFVGRAHEATERALRNRFLLDHALERLGLSPFESQLPRTLLVFHFSLLDEDVGSWPLLAADFAWRLGTGEEAAWRSS